MKTKKIKSGTNAIKVHKEVQNIEILLSKSKVIFQIVV